MSCVLFPICEFSSEDWVLVVILSVTKIYWWSVLLLIACCGHPTYLHKCCICSCVVWTKMRNILCSQNFPQGVLPEKPLFPENWHASRVTFQGYQTLQNQRTYLSVNFWCKEWSQKQTTCTEFYLINLRSAWTSFLTVFSNTPNRSLSTYRTNSTCKRRRFTWKRAKQTNQGTLELQVQR